ncbi:MAG: reverse transcriptase domain-containing protein [Thermodesulfobacteriota bacterium]|nr:reverse transcriptase domain-containing protein [Thermodesulfobacteriota bacterium]
MDGSGETRPLSLPVVRDKIVQQAVRDVTEPKFNPIFLDCSYAYRKGKGPQKVFKRLNHYLHIEKRRWVALGDFDRFFDTIDHDYLIRQITHVMDDPDIIRLIRMWLKTGFVNRRGDYLDIDAGVGQGSVISPLLSNIYVHSLDEYMIQKGYAYIRYSDNFIILSHSRKDVTGAFDDHRFFMSNVLRLTVNENPRPVCSLEDGFVFLGIYYKGRERTISINKLKKIKGKIRHITHRNREPAQLLEKLVRSLDGTRRYYGMLNPELQFIAVDEYLMQRLVSTLSCFVREGIYRNVRELIDYLLPLDFLSDTYNREKDTKLRELAGMAIKENIRVRESQEKSTPICSKIETGIKAADTAVHKRKKRYITEQALSSEVVVKTHGAFVGKKGNRLVVKNKGANIYTRQLEKVNNITIAARGITLSSDLIRECSKSDIPVVFMEANGPPYAMVYTPARTQAQIGLL